MARTAGATDKTPRKPRSDKGQPRGQAAGAEGGDPQHPTTHNNPPSPVVLTDTQRKALFLSGIAKLEALQEAADGHKKTYDTAKSQARLQRKAMHGDGFTEDEIDWAIQLRIAAKAGPKESEAETEKWRHRMRVAEWLGHPIGVQPDLFDQNYVDRTPATDIAKEKGFRAGAEGRACDPGQDGYQPGTEQFQSWISGWHLGQEAIVREKLKPLNEGAADAAASSFNDAMADAPAPGAEGSDGPAPSGDGRPADNFDQDVRPRNLQTGGIAPNPDAVGAEDTEASNESTSVH